MEDSEKRPSNFTHLDEVLSITDTCGTIKELYASEQMSLAYVSLVGRAEEHKHIVMGEVYFIISGSGYLTINDDKYAIKKGDTINIPKEAWHFLESEDTLELLVTTYPAFLPLDVILRDKEKQLGTTPFFSLPIS